MIHAYSTSGTRARPIRRLGAAAPGGLALPDASPTESHMYSPRGVWTDGERVIVADSGNHRVLIWHGFPEHDGAPADVVLGQPDFTSEGPAAGAGDTRRGLYLPTGVAVVAGDLVVADAWHHRLLVWDGIPQDCFVGPGRGDRSGGLQQRGGQPGWRPRPVHVLLAVRLRARGRCLLGGRHRQPQGPGLERGRAHRWPPRGHPAGPDRSGLA